VPTRNKPKGSLAIAPTALTIRIDRVENVSECIFAISARRHTAKHLIYGHISEGMPAISLSLATGTCAPNASPVPTSFNDIDERTPGRKDSAAINAERDSCVPTILISISVLTPTLELQLLFGRKLLAKLLKRRS
jgi:hypothetical protein